MSEPNIDRWISDRLANYLLMIEREMGYESLHGAVSFVIRCMVNPECEGSGGVLDAIVAQRVIREAEATA